MKSLTLSFVLVLALTFQTAANPVDATPVAKISELLFDEDDNWTLELCFPFADNNQAIDSLIITRQYI